MKLSDYQVGKFIKVALAGQPGRGKTSCGLTFPLPMRIYDFDGKLDGPILFARRQGIDLSQIDVLRVTDWNEVALELNREASNPRFKSYGFDSLTTMADHLLGFIGDNKSVEKSGNVKRIGKVQVAGLEEYNAESSGIMDVLLFMKDVQAHVWLTAHVIETKSTTTGDDGKNRITVSRSLLTGSKKVAAKIPAYFPENYSIQIEPGVSSSDPVKFVFYTGNNTEDYGRTGFNLPLKIDFTGKKFFDVLQEKIKEGESK